MQIWEKQNQIKPSVMEKAQPGITRSDEKAHMII